MKNKAKVVLALLAFVLLGTLAPVRFATAQAPAPAYKWKMQTFLPPTDPDHSVNYAKFSEMVEKNTDGRVTIPENQLGKYHLHTFWYPSAYLYDSLAHAWRDGLRRSFQCYRRPTIDRGGYPENPIRPLDHYYHHTGYVDYSWLSDGRKRDYVHQDAGISACH
jgi:hypothetical protein